MISRAPDKALYLAALKEYDPDVFDDRLDGIQGRAAILAVLIQFSPDVAKAKSDLSKTYTNRFVEQWTAVVAGPRMALMKAIEAPCPADELRAAGAALHLRRDPA
jgi:hypothetical protein